MMKIFLSYYTCFIFFGVRVKEKFFWGNFLYSLYIIIIIIIIIIFLVWASHVFLNLYICTIAMSITLFLSPSLSLHLSFITRSPFLSCRVKQTTYTSLLSYILSLFSLPSSHLLLPSFASSSSFLLLSITTVERPEVDEKLNGCL